MDFQLSKMQRMTRSSIREFVRKEVVPLAQELDEKAEFPLKNYRQTVDLGIMDMTLPENLGGSGTDFLTLIIALEEIACGSAALANSIAATEMMVHLLRLYGRSDQQKTFIPALVEAAIPGTVALGENIDAAGSTWPIQALADENDYILDGRLPFIPNAPVADTAVIFAGTADTKISAFILEKNKGGFGVGKPEPMMGQRSLPIGEMTVDQVRVSSANGLGENGKGAEIIEECFSRWRVISGAIAVGISQAALEEAARHSKQRIQFGRTLSSFQAIQNKIADIAAGVEAARLLVYKAAVLMEQHKKKAGRSACIAKVFASELAVEACKEAVQIHGGYGYIKDYAVERLYRDALFTRIYKETNENQRLQIAQKVFNEYR